MGAALLYPRAMASARFALSQWVLLGGLMFMAATTAHATTAYATTAYATTAHATTAHATSPSAVSARGMIDPAIAVAHDDCDEMTLVNERERERALSDDPRDNAARLVEVEVVVPCAMLDSGALGADCHDAAVYVVTTHGTPLCRLDLTTLAAASSRSTDRLEDGPSGSSPRPSGGVLGPAAFNDLATLSILPPAVAELPAPPGPRGLDRGRDVEGSFPRPS
jgi:hypothetical protein